MPNSGLAVVRSGHGQYAASYMGQPITVVEKPAARPGVVRFETNRNLTGMGHESYASAEDAQGNRLCDEVARRIFERGGVDNIHIYANVVTVDLSKGIGSEGLSDLLNDLFVHYQPGVLPPTDEELGITPSL
ncbi:MAG: hypothetical protein ACSLFB_01310 [Acidimicrobiales bacterium]